MRTTFSGIELARRALRAQQRSLDVVGHNVANANTPGYSKQVATHSATNPYAAPGFHGNPGSGQVGTGVEVSQITRQRDQFVEMRLRQENHNLGYWDAVDKGLSQVELIFNEPSDYNIHQALDNYWDSLQELSKNPQDESARAVVLQRAEVLTETIRHTHSQLSKQRENYNDLLAVKASDVNSLAERIAQLNDQIGKVRASGQNPNDLMDKRDVLLEELSALTNIEVVEDSTGMVLVSISGAALVQRNQHYTLAVDSDMNPADYGRNEIVWESSGQPVEIANGEIAGLIHFRDHEVQGFIDDLDSWAEQLLETVNAIHKAGYGLDDAYDPTSDPDDWPGEGAGRPFFTIGAGTSPAADIRLAVTNPRDLAVSRAFDSDTGEIIEGNGDIALALAALRHTPPAQVLEAVFAGDVPEEAVGADDRSTLGIQFNAIVSGLGVKGAKAATMVENERVLVSHLENLRESVSGVSLDEEMADMIRYQHAYSAAARMMTAMDEALETIINRMGLVGR